MIPLKIESAWQGTADCRSCGIRDMVLFADLNESDFSQIHAPIDDLAVRAGGRLYTEAQASQGIFSLRTGYLKLVRHTADGRQRILRVLRPGDVAGLEALATGHYDSEAMALSAVSVCRIPASVIHHLSQNSPRLHLRLLQKWQQALKEADDWLADINFGTARQRVVQFISKMHGHEEPGVAVLFSRADMGAMTDLKLETVSREVSALVKQGLLVPMDRLGRRYRVADEAALRAAA